MRASQENLGGSGGNAIPSPAAIAVAAPPALGPAMRLMLTLAAARSRHGATHRAGGGATIGALWDLAERYHPEQAWLAATWLRGERSLVELERDAPRGPVSPALRHVFAHPSFLAQGLRRAEALAQY